MGIIAHTMQYTDGEIPLSPLLNYCDTREALLNKSENIFILEIDNHPAGSVAIYGNEIDDLIVSKQYRRKGYGQRLLRFAVARMQRESISPIMLHVADWNCGAIELYTKNGFSVVKTETV